MTSKHDSSSMAYTSLPQDQNVVVLSYYHNNHHPPNNYNHYLRRGLQFSAAALLVAAAFYFLYPSDPTLQLARVKLNHVRVNSSPKLTLDLSFDLTIKVHNRDFFSLDYDSLVVSVGYRGRELGFVRSKGGRVGARRTSYVDATLDVDGLEIIHDVIYLVVDLVKGVVPFDTETSVKGDLGFFSFKIPIQGRVSCEVYVNTNNQTIVRQDCYPE